MASVGSSEFDCPVCFNFFTTPKILPCHHLVCQSCVLSWIERTGGRGECPICRAPILTDTFPCSQLQAQVDRLPTDLATQALAESHKILSDPHHCGMCQNVAGQNFCMECSIKLCTACTKYHQKLPGTAHHTVQQLITLTVKQLAARHQVRCESHTQELAQLFCTSHSKLVCFRCGATTHHACPELREVEDVAKEERRKLQDRLERLEVKERNMAQQVNDIKEHFKAMHKTAQDTFNDLSQRVEKQRRDVLNLIQSEEDAMKTSLKKMENARKSTALPLRNISNLVLESPDDGLLEIHQNLLSRLDNLESQMKVKPDTRDVGRLVFDDQTLTRLQSDLAQLGQIQQPTSGPAAGATATTSATASGQRQSQVGPTTAAGATATNGATASGQRQSQVGPTTAAGATAMTSATASGQRQSQVGPTTAAGATATTSATASMLTVNKSTVCFPSHTRQSQQQGGRTSAAEAILTSARNRFMELRIGQRQSQVGPTTAAGATTTTNATASGQRQRQFGPTTAAGATATTSATASGPTTAAKPQGAALAGVLKVGDRVKLAWEASRSWRAPGMQRGDTGTVTAIPSQIWAARGVDPQGWVDVRWDSVGEHWHPMGWNNAYHLTLS